MKTAFGPLCLGAVALVLLLVEWDFGLRARAADVVVLASSAHGRSGRTFAEVRNVDPGRPWETTLRLWYLRLDPGERVRVLYLPNDPDQVVLDTFWQRHYRSTIAFAAFSVFALSRMFGHLTWRRRRTFAILRDDYEGPLVGTTGTPALPIDTTPRLWDRELDG